MFYVQKCSILLFAMLIVAHLNSCSNHDSSVDENGEPKELILGYFSGNDVDEVLAQQMAMREYLKKALNMPVKEYTATSYAAVVEAMRTKRIHAFALGPFAYVLSVQESNAEALAMNVHLPSRPCEYDPESKPQYFSVFVTKKGSGIKSLADLKGKSIAFVDPASTSGHLFPKALLVKNGIDPDQDVKWVFAGSHASAVMAVENGKVDACATLEDNLFRLQKEKMIAFCSYPDNKARIVRTQEELDALYETCPDGNLVIFAQSDPIPSTPFAIRKELPQSFKDKVRNVLLDIKNHPDIIRETCSWYVDPSAELGYETVDQCFNSVREVAKLLDLDLREIEQ